MNVELGWSLRSLSSPVPHPDNLPSVCLEGVLSPFPEPTQSKYQEWEDFKSPGWRNPALPGLPNNTRVSFPWSQKHPVLQAPSQAPQRGNGNTAQTPGFSCPCILCRQFRASELFTSELPHREAGRKKEFMGTYMGRGRKPLLKIWLTFFSVEKFQQY